MCGMAARIGHGRQNKARAESIRKTIKLIGILREMAVDIDSVMDIDFNDALKALVK